MKEEREIKGTRKKAYLQSSLEKSGEKRRMEVRLEVLIQRGGKEEGERNRVEERGMIERRRERGRDRKKEEGGGIEREGDNLKIAFC